MCGLGGSVMPAMDAECRAPNHRVIRLALPHAEALSGGRLELPQVLPQRRACVLGDTTPRCWSSGMTFSTKGPEGAARAVVRALEVDRPHLRGISSTRADS